MAESPIERLKRLAREKKEAAAKVVAAPEVPEVLVTQPEVEPANPATGEAGALAAVDAELAKLSGLSKQAEELTDANKQPEIAELVSESGAGTEVTEPNAGQLSSTAQNSAGETALAAGTSGDTYVTGSESTSRSSHPLAMEFAEMEAALLSKDPEFKMILRNIHRHLATDPDLVTQMTEEEIQSVVSGLVVIANAEVVEPAKAKTLKAKVAAAKKVVISVDDLQHEP